MARIRAVMAALVVGGSTIVLTSPATAATTTVGNTSTTFDAGRCTEYTPPVGTASLSIELNGASGGVGEGAFAGITGGSGAQIFASLTVQPGDTFEVCVGGAGGSDGSGGFNGGGSARNQFAQLGGGGGGATDLRRNGSGLANRILVAAGGGGASGAEFDGGFGNYRYSIASGMSADVNTPNACNLGSLCGGRGSASAGGAAGAASSGTGWTVVNALTPPTAGSSGVGGAGGAVSVLGPFDPNPNSGAVIFVVMEGNGGGGGGGWFGGGGGGYAVPNYVPGVTSLITALEVRYGGGGAGSNYAHPDIQFPFIQGSPNSGDGSARITAIPGDTTPPSISATATKADGTAYTAGSWSNQDVTVDFTCSDAGTGIDSCVGDTTLTTTGVTASVEGKATDRAGNTNTITFGPVRIDKRAPQITASAETADGAPYTAGTPTTQAVTVTFSCSDADSGIASCPAPVTLNASAPSVPGTATDVAGNQATASFGAVVIDRAGPSISVSASAGGAPYVFDTWTAADVTVTFTCTDDVSDGIASCTGSTTVTSEGITEGIVGVATDKAGNTASTTSGRVRIDKTPPTVTPSAKTADGQDYVPGTVTNQAVTVSYTCVDSGAGVSLCQSPITLDPADFPVESSTVLDISVVDDVGNRTGPILFGPIVFDAFGPKATPSLAPAANSAGWNNGNVTVTWNWAEDGLAGIDPSRCPQTSVISAEGFGSSVTAECFDNLGNKGTATASANIDRTGPTITGSATTADGRPYVGGTPTNQAITITFTCDDALSGVAFCPPVTTFDPGDFEDASTMITSVARDRAGNAVNQDVLRVVLDLVAPAAAPTTSPAPNAAGWNNGNVTVTWNWTDQGVAGLDDTRCPQTSTISTEGSSATATVECFDRAGNRATATASVKLDKTPPTLSATISPTLIGLGGTATATPTASDALSGLRAPATCDPVVTTAVGAFTVTCRAVDVAGNQTTIQVPYTVGLRITDFAPPNKTSIRRGSTIPVKFQLVDAGGRAVSDTLARSLTASVAFAGTSTTATYNASTKVFQANVKTSSSLRVGSTQTLAVTVRSGAAVVATITSTVFIAR
jgi:hypothetical protein